MKRHKLWVCALTVLVLAVLGALARRQILPSA